MYEMAEKEHIDIFNWKWSNTKARIFEIDSKYSIALNINKINNSIEEKEILAEELAHYYCNALYYIILYYIILILIKCKKINVNIEQ